MVAATDSSEKRRWGIDCTLSFSFVLALLTTVAAVAGVFSAFNTRLEHVENVTLLLASERNAQQQVVVKVARIDERVAAMQEVLSEIKVQLRLVRR
ncbi:MAG: hypothetical protein MI749_14840 [Desulfovibrionales bacterium]|nr:hypothetical protein [Desulfovibrionales bacterium]